jgi:hypothetical protein
MSVHAIDPVPVKPDGQEQVKLPTLFEHEPGMQALTPTPPLAHSFTSVHAVVPVPL